MVGGKGSGAERRWETVKGHRVGSSVSSSSQSSRTFYPHIQHSSRVRHHIYASFHLHLGELSGYIFGSSGCILLQQTATDLGFKWDIEKYYGRFKSFALCASVEQTWFYVHMLTCHVHTWCTYRLKLHKWVFNMVFYVNVFCFQIFLVSSTFCILDFQEDQ